jgi:hypothetical protein
MAISDPNDPEGDPCAPYHWGSERTREYRVRWTIPERDEQMFYLGAPLVTTS